MTFFNQIEKLFPYLKSIRRLKPYLSIDIEIPTKWKLPKKYLIQDRVMEQQKNSDKSSLISFISEFNQGDIDKTIHNINGIIDFNKELEEKELLFANKVKELKEIFEKQNLDNLQKLEFDIKEYNLSIDEDGEGETDKLAQK